MRIALIAAALVATAAMPAGGSAQVAVPGSQYKQFVPTEKYSGELSPGFRVAVKNHGASDDFAKTISTDVMSIPVQYGLTNGAGIDIETYASIHDFNFVTGGGATEQTTGMSRASIDMRGTHGDMVFFESTTGKLDPATRRQTVIDQLSYIIDFEQRPNYSSSPAFLSAFRADVNDRTIDQITKDGFFRYTDPTEVFAEAMSRQIQPAVHQEAFNRDFPNTMAAAHDLLRKMQVPLSTQEVEAERAATAAYIAKSNAEREARRAAAANVGTEQAAASNAAANVRAEQAAASNAAAAKLKAAVEAALIANNAKGTDNEAAAKIAAELAYFNARLAGTDPEAAAAAAVVAVVNPRPPGIGISTEPTPAAPPATPLRPSITPPKTAAPLPPLITPVVPTAPTHITPSVPIVPTAPIQPPPSRPVFRVGPGLPPGGTFAPAQN